ncbi:hypothetical protein [Spirosoma aerolatum]|uniref:hypothetical protein n=1 Tax=Spirosoma aerolatum TaxID=1211326 RepID=UPI0009AEB576|nr:hypothetical protein [Spirosoma aerolatum]
MADQTTKKAMQFTIDEEIAELNREIGLRYGFYKKKVDAGQMTQMDADYKIGVMTSAMNRLKALKFLLSNISNPY